MKRLLRIRILIVLIALALIPAVTLPFAERIRAEWVRFWEPEEEEVLVEYLDYGVMLQPSVFPVTPDLRPSGFEPPPGQTLTVPVEPAIELPDA